MIEKPIEIARRASWMQRVARAMVAIAILLAAAGFCYENIAEARDRRFNPGRGQMVNVRLHGESLAMHIDCTGDGTPAVIFDSGLGDSYLSWRKVQPQIAEFTRTCSYDRAGIGYSSPSSAPRTSQAIADELNALLHAANVAPPYVLVGHSMGGYDVRVFAHSYRSEVAGLVLVDASHPDQEARFPPELKNMEGTWMREAEFLEYTMPFGIPRLLGLCDDSAVERAVECNFHTERERVAEMKAFPESGAEAGASGSLGDLPLAVLSHDPDKPSAELPADLAQQVNQAWEKMQEELAHLSTRGTQTIAKNSAHYIQIDRPEVVVEAVRNVVNQARTAPQAANVSSK
jgi:pimeloyl-ACP methyl ester carboxylesterase